MRKNNVIDIENESLAYRLAEWVVLRCLMIRDVRVVTVSIWCEKNAPDATEEQQAYILKHFSDYLTPLDVPQPVCG